MLPIRPLVPTVAALLLCSGLAWSHSPDSSGEIASREIGGGNVVRLPGGDIIHTALGKVSGVTHVPLPEGGVLVLWEEAQHGGNVPYFAYSLDGRSLSGRVRQNSTAVHLRYSTFDPIKNGEPPVNGDFQAMPGSRLHLVQLHATPLPEMQAAIAELGGEVLRHLPEHTMIVRMGQAEEAQVAGLPFVRWTGPFHVAYKLDSDVVMDIMAGVDDNIEVRYSIEVFDRGMVQQQVVADAVRAMGGVVEVFTADQFRMEATVTPAQILQIAGMDEVHFVDHWGGPAQTDMDIVRETGNANYLETLGFTGQGVRGEIFDTELRVTHQEFSTFTPIIHSNSATPGSAHGTSVFGHVFGRGAVATARGLLPNAQGRIFYRSSEATQFGGTLSRLAANQQLVNPSGPYRAVFQTSSVGSTRTTSYTTISTEVDDYLYQTRLLSTQSQSNAGSTTQPRNSRPQAWAKNIVSGGAVNHLNTLTRTDDRWLNPGGASIGPAADNRIKPDLAFFYDNTHAPSNGSNTTYTQFGGTSGATPSIAGYFGLFFQMWHEGVWDGRGGGSSVFASRANMTTAKAALINTAYRYNWNSGGFNASINRYVQGWGVPDLKPLYDLRDKTVIVDEEDVLFPLGVNTYQISVEQGEPLLNVVMSYIDRAGTTSASIHRINDLSLRVTSPTGTRYWGNNGLVAGNFSTPGGSSNTRDTVECVFIQNPTAGVWTVEVFGDVIVQDTNPGTPGINANYGMWITGATEFEPDKMIGMPIPTAPFGSTFSSANLTRGSWFEAPVDFVITGLRVPDESGSGLQNVEVVRLDAAPPAWNTTTNDFVSLARHVGVSSNRVIPVHIPVTTGDIIGILGAAGNSSTMHSSYATTVTYEAEFLGKSATMRRLGMQSNLATNPAASLFTEPTNSLSRVEIFHKAPGTGTLTTDESNNGLSANGGVFFDLTALADLTVTGFEYYANTASGQPAAVEVWTRPGSYVGFTNSSSGWTLHDFVEVTSHGASEPTPLPLTELLRLEADETTGVYLIGVTGGIRYNGIGSNPPQVTHVGDDLTLYGEHARSAPFGGSQFTPRTFSGTVHYTSLVAANEYVRSPANTGRNTLVRDLPRTSQFVISSSELTGIQPGTPIGGVAWRLFTPQQATWPTSAVQWTEYNVEVSTSVNSPANLSTTFASNIGPDNVMVRSGPLTIPAGSFTHGGTPTNDFGHIIEFTTPFVYQGGDLLFTIRHTGNGDNTSFLDSLSPTADGWATRFNYIDALTFNATTGTAGSFPITQLVIGGAQECYANCDGSTIEPILNVDDFTCFINAFASAQNLPHAQQITHYANCDGSTIAPVLNVDDFTCFINEFAQGCP